jgi:hypothetical protein
MCFLLVNAQGGIKPEATGILLSSSTRCYSWCHLDDPPSDAIILFEWKESRSVDQYERFYVLPKWILADNVMTVNKSTGDIQTRASFSIFSCT